MKPGAVKHREPAQTKRPAPDRLDRQLEAAIDRAYGADDYALAEEMMRFGFCEGHGAPTALRLRTS